MLVKETDKSVITFRDDGVIIHSYKAGSSIDREEAERVLDIIAEHNHGRVLLINDLRAKVSFTREAREYFQTYGPKNSVTAFVINSKIGEVIVNFHLRFNMPDYALRVFRDMESATQWICEQREEIESA